MSTDAKSGAKSGALKSAVGSITRTRILVSAAAMGVGAVSLAATMVMVPAIDSAMAALGVFAVQNPIPLVIMSLFALGHSPVGGLFVKPKTGAQRWVACAKCNRMFRDQGEVERHSAGYHV